MPKRATFENAEYIQNYIKENYLDLNEALKDAREITALLAVYGTDSAIKACSEFYSKVAASMQNANNKIAAEPELLIFKLRCSLFPKTKISKEDIEMLFLK